MWKGLCSDKLCDVETDLVCSKTRTTRVIQCIETEELKSGSLVHSSDLLSENPSAKSTFLFSGYSEEPILSFHSEPTAP